MYLGRRVFEFSEVQIEIHSIDFDGVTTKCVNLATNIDLIYNTN